MPLATEFCGNPGQLKAPGRNLIAWGGSTDYKFQVGTLLRLLASQGGRCAYSFLPICMETRNVFSFSIERININEGYSITFDENDEIVESNIVIICACFQSTAKGRAFNERLSEEERESARLCARTDVAELRRWLNVDVQEWEAILDRDREYCARLFLGLKENERVPDSFKRNFKKIQEFIL